MKKEDKNKKAKSDELENQLKKALSDYQNLKRDMTKRLDFEEAMIRKGVMRELIELADDIDMAMDSVHDEKGWREGVSNILNKFYTVIAGIGGQMIEVKKGDNFDPEKHEAVGTVSEGEDGKIVKVVQNGYTLNDMVVRPSRVIVCKSENKK